jgi:hypothetical protein
MAERDRPTDEKDVKPSTPADDDPLGPALAALDRGDLVETKRLARELASRDGVDAAVKSRAENLLAQLAPDPLTIAVMVATGLLAVVLYLVYHH